MRSRMVIARGSAAQAARPAPAVAWKGFTERFKPCWLPASGPVAL
jgi:hypothetical protein